MKNRKFFDVFYHDVMIHEIKISNNINDENKKKVIFSIEFTDEEESFGIKSTTCLIPDLIAFTYQANMMYCGIDTIVSIEKLSIEDLWVRDQLNLLYNKLDNIVAYRIILSPASEMKLLLTCDETVILDY